MSYWDSGKRFVPKREGRGSGDYEFFELSLAQGPVAIGVTGENRLIDFIGTAWLLLLDLDMELHLFRQAATVGEWTEVTVDLPPVFAAPLPAGARRVSFAFDQSARINLAYEELELIYLTRWDPTANAYIQNVSVAGVDPFVTFDATWAYDIPLSDVLLFYLSVDRTKLMVRVQRDRYEDEYELHDYGQAVVFDRVTRLPLRYQALASDAAGEPLAVGPDRVGLLSELYPYLATDSATVASLALNGDYLVAVIRRAERHEVLASATGVSGVYAIAVRRESGAEEADVSVAAANGVYVVAVIRRAGGPEEADVAAAAGNGLYEFIVIRVNPNSILEADVSAAAQNGVYDLP